MSDGYVILVSVFAAATDAGGAADLDACGVRYHQHNTQARDFDDAVHQAKTFAVGIATNPRVWQANVVRVEKL